MQRFPNLVAILSTAVIATLPARLDAQGVVDPPKPLQTISINILRTPTATGPEYRFGILAVRPFINGGTIVAPDGTLFGNNYSDPGAGPVSFVDDLSLSELMRRFQGEWTINGRPTPDTSETHTFEVLPFTAADIPDYAPVIESPREGAAVGPSFEVTWTAEGPPSLSVGGFGHSNFRGDLDMTFAGPNTSHAYTTLRDGVASDEVSFFISGSSSLNPFVTAPQAVGSDSLVDYWTSLHFKTYSEYRTVTVTGTPEPVTVALFAVAAFSLGTHRRRRI